MSGEPITLPVPGVDNGAGAGGQVHLRFAATQQAVRDALDQLDAEMAVARVPVPQMRVARIVLGEVFNNVVEHAYAGCASGEIEATIELSSPDLGCEVRDAGIAIEGRDLPGATYPPIDPGHPASAPESGFGWALVRDLTTALSYERRPGENVLRFRIPPASAR